MVFNSIYFLLFFMLFATAYFLLPPRVKAYFLLGSSYLFYLFYGVEQFLFLLVLTIINFYFSRILVRSKNRTRLVSLMILFNLILFIGLKYGNFITLNLNGLLAEFEIPIQIPLLNLIVPLGISYFMFKKISYLIDIQRGQIVPEQQFVHYANYITFFPQIVAGPIDRGRSLIPQLKRGSEFNSNLVSDGLQLFLWGLFKKVVIADRISEFIIPFFNRPERFNGIELLIALFLFSIQIYSDFSGYTDMAIGISRAMGFKIAENFNDPYYAKSIGAFWKRWHMTLTSWLMDYLFLPIAYWASGKLKNPSYFRIRSESWIYMAAAISTMLICGIWHGARWTFILWGGFHGLWLVLSFLTRKIRKNGRKWFRKWLPGWLIGWFRTILTFSTVSLLWVLFRAETVEKAELIYQKIGQWLLSILIQLQSEPGRSEAIFHKSEFTAIVVMLLVAYASHLLRRRRWLFPQHKPLIRWVAYLLLTLIIINFGAYTETPFLYMQF